MTQRNDEEAAEETEKGDNGDHEEVMRRLRYNFFSVIVTVELLHLVCLG